MSAPARWQLFVAGPNSLEARGVSGCRLTARTRHELTAAARALGGLRQGGSEELVVFVQGPKAAKILKLPERGDPDWRAVGRSGWLVSEREPRTHLAPVPAVFASLEPAELLQALELFSDALGLTYAYSPAASVHQALRWDNPRLGEAAPDPLPRNAWADAAAANPGWSWNRRMTAQERPRQFVRAFDRAGSYLSAWSGLRLPLDDWQPGPIVASARCKESERPAGYYLVDPCWPWLAELRHMPPLLARAELEDGARRWITAPLLQLLTEAAPPGHLVPVLGSLTCASSTRALDGVAGRLRDARAALTANPSPPAQAALSALKLGYAGAVAWFEFGATRGPLARPSWRRTIIDRYVANTWRSLSAAAYPPFAMSDVDTAYFATPTADATPPGLRLGTELGAWRPKGTAVRMSDAIRALNRDSLRGLHRLIEERAA